MSRINNFLDSDIMDGMGILNLLDTEYIDELGCENLTLKPKYGNIEEDPEAKKTYVTKPNDRYTYRSMLEVLFPD
jgi:hypothetical protein